MKDMLDGMPIVAKIVAAIGFPSAIACYLVWVLVTGVATAAQVYDVKAVVVQSETRREQEQAAVIALLEAQLAKLRIMCVSTAKSEATRIECSR